MSQPLCGQRTNIACRVPLAQTNSSCITGTESLHCSLFDCQIVSHEVCREGDLIITTMHFLVRGADLRSGAEPNFS